MQMNSFKSAACSHTLHAWHSLCYQ